MCNRQQWDTFKDITSNLWPWYSWNFMLFQCFYLYLCLFHTNNISKMILSSHFKNLLPFLYRYHLTFHDWIYIFLFLWPSVLDILFQDLKLCIIFWVNNIGIAISHLFSDIINFISSISTSWLSILSSTTGSAELEWDFHLTSRFSFQSNIVFLWAT